MRQTIYCDRKDCLKSGITDKNEWVCWAGFIEIKNGACTSYITNDQYIEQNKEDLEKSDLNN